MTLRRFAPWLLSLSLLAAPLVPVAHAYEGMVAGDAEDDAPPKKTYPEVALTPQILYQFLLAEIAAQRRQFPLSASAYADLAKSTRDARIARRATEIALHARQFDAGIESARLWTELEPDEPAARQMLAALLVGSQRLDELHDTLARDLSAAGGNLGETLLRLNRVLARNADKGAVQRLVERLTLPYLDLPEAHFVRAQAAANARDVMRALAEIDQALALRPDWEMGALFKAQQLPSGAPARAFLAEFVTRNPQAREARLAYARSLVADNQHEAARREFRVLLDAFPQNADLAYAVGVLSLQLNDTAEAELRLKTVVEIGQAKADAARFYLGQIAEAGKRGDEALTWYSSVPAGENFVAAQVRAAQILMKQSRFLEARAGLLSARERVPAEAPRLAVAEAELIRETGDTAEAYAFLVRQLAAYPESDELLYEAGIAAERVRRFADAETHFRALIKRKPDSPQGYNALGYSLAERGERLEEAEALIDKALALAPEDYYILDSKGWVLFRRGKAEEGLAYLRRAFSVRPEPEIAAHIGEVLWMLGQKDEAQRIWREADQANPGNAELGATIKRFLP